MLYSIYMAKNAITQDDEYILGPFPHATTSFSFSTCSSISRLVLAWRTPMRHTKENLNNKKVHCRNPGIENNGIWQLVNESAPYLYSSNVASMQATRLRNYDRGSFSDDARETDFY